MELSEPLNLEAKQGDTFPTPSPLSVIYSDDSSVAVYGISASTSDIRVWELK